MEIALEKLAEHGVMGLFLIMVMVYFIKETRSLKDDLKEKEKLIQNLNDKSRDEAVENNSLFKDVMSTMKELTVELKIRNNG